MMEYLMHKPLPTMAVGCWQWQRWMHRQIHDVAPHPLTITTMDISVHHEQSATVRITKIMACGLIGINKRCRYLMLT